VEPLDRLNAGPNRKERVREVAIQEGEDRVPAEFLARGAAPTALTNLTRRDLTSGKTAAMLPVVSKQNRARKAELLDSKATSG
jgi:hypothetical protein